MHDAKDNLSYKINSLITSKSETDLNILNETISLKSVKNIQALSEIALRQTTQYDIYIDEDKNLYILIGLRDQKSLATKKIELYDFDMSELLDSGCYPKETVQDIKTTSYMYKEKPLWFYEPYIKNHHTAIGIAPKLDNNYERQKRGAVLQAKMNLIRDMSSHIKSKQSLMQLLKHDESATVLQESGIHKSRGVIKGVEVKDIWMDPDTCELYIYSIK